MTSLRLTKKQLLKLEKERDGFNAKYPVGTAVMLKKDFVDEPVKTVVTYAAFIRSDHVVAFFEGISGSYAIWCVKGLSV